MLSNSYPARSKFLSIIVEVIIGLSGVAGMVGFASPTITLAGSTGVAISFGLAVCGLVGVISRIVDYDELTIIALRMQAAIYFVWSIVLFYYTFDFTYSGVTKPNIQGVMSLLVITMFNVLVSYALTKGIKREREAVTDFKASIALEDEQSKETPDGL